MEYKYIFLAICLLATKIALVQGECKHYCMDNNRPVGDRCEANEANATCYYLFYNKWATWDLAYDHCRSQGLAMAEFNENIVRSRYRVMEHFANKQDVFIGARAVDFDKWTYVQNKGVEAGLDSSTDLGAKCVSINWQKLALEFIDCSTKTTYVCRRNGCATTDITCITFYNDQKNWFEARQDCLARGGDLFYPVLNGLLEAIVLILQLLVGHAIHPVSSSFIGLHMKEWQWQGNFTNVNRTIIYTDWLDGEPNDYFHDCAAIDQSLQWVDAHCNDHKRILCQGDAIPSPYVPTTSLSTSKSSSSTSSSSSTTTTTAATTTTTTPTTTTTTPTTPASTSTAAATTTTTEAASTTTLETVKTTKDISGGNVLPVTVDCKCDCSEREKQLIIAVIILAVLLGLCLIGMMIYCIVNQMRKPRQQRNENSYDDLYHIRNLADRPGQTNGGYNAPAAVAVENVYTDLDNPKKSAMAEGKSPLDLKELYENEELDMKAVAQKLAY